MKKLMLVGGGKIGSAIAEFLSRTGDYRITVLDKDTEALDHLANENLDIGVSDLLRDDFASTAAGYEIVVSAVPFHLTTKVAEGCRRVGAHYFDLTEDVESTRAIKQLADGAETAFVPQCGLAPGFVSIVAYELASRFDRLRDVQLRVGALPVFPHNALKYNLTWSTDGLINEYCNPCESIRDQRRRDVPPLEELETFSFDGIEYEAFNTSGGLGTLCDTLDGKVENLNYKTVRYPGHRDIIKMLVRDLRLGARRDILKDVLETAVPVTLQDVVLVLVTVSGWKDGRLTQETYAQKIYGRTIAGRPMSAIQITTASGICAMVDLLGEGRLPQKGFVRQEQTCLSDFLANRFGRNFDLTGHSLDERAA
ncbi:MAG TPA: saccharopine dehydrogenase C-terminal domain-containing protein [Alphaproteobacteria bacterium]|nr:saccharopine dehydrogenase C-terminal domain-containing protein [Alphaproteobacteria bacterium]